MIGGVGDDGLRGGGALDIYDFERPDWGQDAIRDASPGNLVRLPDGDDFGGSITINLNSDAGPLPEVANAEGGSTVDWKGDVVAVVVGSTGDDTVTGNDATNLIFDEDPDTDHDTIYAAGGATSSTCRTPPPTTRWRAARATTRSTSIRNSKWSPPPGARSRTLSPTPRKGRVGPRRSGWDRRKGPWPAYGGMSSP